MGACWLHDGCMMGCDGLRWVAMGCDGLRWVAMLVAMGCDGLRCWSRWIAKGGVRGTQFPGSSRNRHLIICITLHVLQAVRTELALMAQLANDMSASQRSRVRIPRVATVKPPSRHSSAAERLQHRRSHT